jgi:hypothetical protein
MIMILRYRSTHQFLSTFFSYSYGPVFGCTDSPSTAYCEGIARPGYS